MKLLLGSLLLAGFSWLVAAVTVPVMENFDNQRIAKAWYPLLSIPTGRTRNVKFRPFRFVTQPNGNLKYRRKVPQKGECKIKEVMLYQQGQPGDYLTTTNRTLRFVETDYNTYFIAYINRDIKLADTFLALAGSQPKVTAALEAKFRTTATSLGITGKILQSVLRATC